MKYLKLFENKTETTKELIQNKINFLDKEILEYDNLLFKYVNEFMDKYKYDRIGFFDFDKKTKISNIISNLSYNDKQDLFEYLNVNDIVNDDTLFDRLCGCHFINEDALLDFIIDNKVDFLDEYVDIIKKDYGIKIVKKILNSYKFQSFYLETFQFEILNHLDDIDIRDDIKNDPKYRYIFNAKNIDLI